MAFTSGDQVPYAPPSTIIDVLRRYRDRGLPSPLTGEVLTRAGVPETLTQRTLQSLKLLRLIDAEGKPEDQFLAANRAPEDEYKTRLGELITEVYSEAITFADPANDSYDRVRDAFRAYNPQGQQDRMVTLFLGLLEYVGLDTSAAAVTRSITEGGRSATRAPGTKRLQAPKKPPRGNSRKQQGAGKSDETLDHGFALPASIAGLLRDLPAEGRRWTPQRRDAWLQTFTVVLDYAFPTGTEDSVGASDDDEDAE
jgi:hypothetical protein